MLKRHLVRPLSIVVILGALNSCGDSVKPSSTQVESAVDPATGSGLPDLAESESWVRRYDPESAFNGFTLAFFLRRTPILIDMNGRVVHAWPQARLKSRLRLSASCTLLGIGLDRSVIEYDWDGREIWKHTFPGETPHHEVVWLDSGNVLTVLRRGGQKTDDLVELDRAGNIVWEWSSEILEPFFGEAASKGDITHINSVQELFPNRLFDGGDTRFKPGNLLVSARNINLVFVIDRTTGGVVWTYGHELDLQHEALMIEPGMPGAGNILLFNNGYRNTYVYRQSSVIEVDPANSEVVWEWKQKGFYSPTGGIEQPLPNGNILISSSRGGRAFEVTRDGRIVWEWIPPYDPNRPQRYSYDHCQRFERLDRGDEQPVDGGTYRHIDPDSYRFARRGSLNKVNIDGTTTSVLVDGNQCSSVVLPDSAIVHLSYGLNRRPLNRRQIQDPAVEFRFVLRPADSTDSIVLLEDRVDLSSETWRAREIDVAKFAYQTVDLCVATKGAGGKDDEAALAFAYWANPVVVSTTNPQSALQATASPPSDLTAEELAAQQEHLKTLGYLD